MAMSTALAAHRALFERTMHAVLCTAHADSAGWPFGSVVPYAVLTNGDAVVFLSDIAEHTRNLQRDPRASLFVTDPAAQERPQAGARVCVLARAHRPLGNGAAAAEAAYFARFPQAAAMRSAHGFAAWVLEVERVRWIAGFGEMGWFDRATWSGLPDALAAHAAAIVAHMNADHADAVRLLCRHFAGVDPATARLIAVDRGGFVACATTSDGGERHVRFPFPAAIDDPAQVRGVVVAMVEAARRALS